MVYIIFTIVVLALAGAYWQLRKEQANLRKKLDRAQHKFSQLHDELARTYNVPNHWLRVQQDLTSKTLDLFEDGKSSWEERRSRAFREYVANIINAQPKMFDLD